MDWGLIFSPVWIRIIALRQRFLSRRRCNSWRRVCSLGGVGIRPPQVRQRKSAVLTWWDSIVVFFGQPSAPEGGELAHRFLAHSRRRYPAAPLQLTGTLTLEQYGHDNFGFPRVEVTKEQILEPISLPPTKRPKRRLPKRWIASLSTQIRVKWQPSKSSSHLWRADHESTVPDTPRRQYRQ